MALILLILAVLLALGVVAFLVLREREQARAVPTRVAPPPRPQPPPVFDLDTAPEPQPLPVVVAEPEPLPEITWPRQLDPSASLDDAARAALIADLAKLRAAWCVPILERALEEERDSQMRQAVREALDVSFRGAASQL